MTNQAAIYLLADVAAKIWDSENLDTVPPSTEEESEEGFLASTANNENDDPNCLKTGGPYWMQENWVPRTSSGSQVTPEQIRSQLRHFIETSKHTKTTILNAMGVNSNSFRKFMTREYKESWRAAENGTYWAAARMFEAHLHVKRPSMESCTYSRKSCEIVTMTATTLGHKDSSASLKSLQTSSCLKTNRRALDSLPRGRRPQESAAAFAALMRSILSVEIRSSRVNRLGAMEVAAMGTRHYPTLLTFIPYSSDEEQFDVRESNSLHSQEAGF